MRPEDLAQANELLAHPKDIDLSVSQRLGLHVVARLAARHHIRVTLTTTPGSGITAAVVLPAELFADDQLELATTTQTPAGQAPPTPTIPQPRGPARHGHARPDPNWTGWWTPTRLPMVETSGRSAAPVYATAQKMEPPVAPPIVTPVAPPKALPATPAVSATGAAAADPPLNRRVPQANLAAELRRTSPAGAAAILEPTPTSDANRARDALSRYQASQQAAQKQVNGNTGGGR